MGDIIVVGNINSDFFVDSKWPETKSGNLPSMCYPVGAKIFVKNFDMFIGGGGFNTSVTFSRMGLKTSYFGKIIKDSQGDNFLKALKKEKIKFIGPRGKGIGGHSIILDTLKHHRTIFVFKGRDNHINFKDFKKQRADWFHFASMIGKSLQTQIEIAKYAKKNGIKTSYNPSEYLIRAERKAVLRLVKNVNVIILNKEEAELLVDSKEKVAEKLMDLGPEIICITDGKNGAIAYDYKNEKIYSILTNEVKIRETAGAGDAFASGFITGIIKKNDIKFALDLGLSNSESVIQHLGTTNKILNWSQVSRQKKHTIRVTKW